MGENFWKRKKPVWFEFKCIAAAGGAVCARVLSRTHRLTWTLWPRPVWTRRFCPALRRRFEGSGRWTGDSPTAPGAALQARRPYYPSHLYKPTHISRRPQTLPRPSCGSYIHKPQEHSQRHWQDSFSWSWKTVIKSEEENMNGFCQCTVKHVPTHMQGNNYISQG